MVELPPLEDDELPPVASKKYQVPFKLAENMLCYNCNEDAYGRRDLVGWLDVVDEHYTKTHARSLETKVYTSLLTSLRASFPGLDFDAVSRYCDDERLCPRLKLIEAWRAFISNMNWDECDEPEPRPSTRQQKRKK